MLQQPSLNKGLRPIVVDKPDYKCIVYLESDEQLRKHLNIMLRAGIKHLPVRLEDRPRPFSEISTVDVDNMYGSDSSLPLGGLPSTTS